MDRLTKRIGSGIERVCHYGYGEDKMCYGCVQRTKCNADIFERLADYEDTELPPEVCANYKIFEDEAVGKGVTFNRIVELMNAEAEGRLVVLPCKPEETLLDYSEFFDGTEHPEYYKLKDGYWEVGLEADGKTFELRYEGIHIKPSDIGKTVFFTREEAEAALKGADNPKPLEIEKAAEEARRMGISYGQHMYDRREQP